MYIIWKKVVSREHVRHNYTLRKYFTEVFSTDTIAMLRTLNKALTSNTIIESHSNKLNKNIICLSEDLEKQTSK